MKIGVLTLMTAAALAFASTASATVDEPNAPNVLADVILGTSGDDVLRGTPSADRIRSFAGEDTIRARAGRDRIAPGADVDTVFAGRGRDRISAVDGRRDIIFCGDNFDWVLVDPQDQLHDCEGVVVDHGP